MTRAISATVISSSLEMLKSSFAAAGWAVAVTIPSAMSSMWVIVRVCSPEPKICSGFWPDSTFLITSGTMWAMPGSSSGISPGPYALNGRQIVYSQPVLVVQRAAVELAGQLREAVRRRRDRRVA